MTIEFSSDVDPDVTKAVKRLADRCDITDLISRYGLMADTKTFQDARTCFTEDVVAEYPAGGAEGVGLLAHYGSLALGSFERTQHVITNVLIDLGDDAADVRANLIASHVHCADNPEEHFDTGCRYRFHVVRTPKGWKISRLHLTEIWTTGSRVGTRGVEDLVASSSQRPREIMQDLDAQLHADPERTENIEAVYQFEITGLHGGAWWLDARNGVGAIHQGRADDPTTTIRLSDNVFVMLATHELDGAEAFFNGHLTVDGDESKAIFLSQIFGE